MKRVVVFIDGQNFYRNARRAFFDDARDAYHVGQFRPTAVGQLLAVRDPDRALQQVRIYTGRPDAYLQPKAHAANVRQCAAWEAQGCYVFTRPLRYPPGYPNSSGRRPEEKGIDVAMAVDLTRLAQDDHYDVAIVCTGDTDLIPAVEDVLDGGSGATVEVAGWRSAQYRQRLSLPGRNIWCHWLGWEDYQRTCDNTDYAAPSPPP
jgi:uncharacterized LabA/DUF88 family protein